ncbi:MAG TPA: LuxR C-terminal-related transcriptional regulator [Chitinophagales bacterium]|nr:LuxR C-terminal-related transcriptional regulator [Chitinophagales bacterium]
MANRISSRDVDEAMERFNALSFPPVEGSPEFKDVIRWYQQAHKLNYKKGMAATAGFICRLYIAHKQFTKLLPYLKEMRELCEENGKWTEMYADCLIMSIETDFTFGRFDEAVATSNIFLSGLINEVGPVKAMNTYVIISHLYQARGWYIRALRVCYEGMTRMGELQKVYNAVGLCINYAHALFNVKQYDSALKEFLAIMGNKDIRLNPHAEAHCHAYLSQIYATGFGDNEKCIEHYNRAIEISREHDIEATISMMQVCHGFSLTSLKRYAEALSLFQNEKVLEAVQDSIIEHASVLNSSAWCLLNLNRPDEAWTELQQVDRMLTQVEDNLNRVAYYRNCSFYHLMMGNKAEAARKLQLQEQAQDKVNSQEFAMQLEQVNAMMELDKKQHELEMQKLKQEKIQQQLDYAVQEKEMMQVAIDQRNALINEFQAAINKIERSDIKRSEIFQALNEKISSVKNSNTSISDFDIRFNEKHKKNSLILSEKYPELSASEIKIACMLASGLSNKEIASVTLTTIRNVENHRLQLRKKIKLKVGEDLIKKLLSILG